MSPQEFTERFIDPWLNKLTLPQWCIIPLISGGFGFLPPDRDTRVRMLGARVSLFGADNASLFYNGIFYFRMMLPFFIGFHIRWAGRNPSVREFLQFYIGWKFNGKFSIVFRAQSDESAAAGFTSKNPNQAIGWNDGGK